MAQREAVAAPSVRQEIERALAGIQATPMHLASQLGLPVRVVREQLEMMAREMVVQSRRHRSGVTLYRLRDAQDPRWDAHRGLGIHITR